MKVLYIEDDIVDQKILKRMLRHINDVKIEMSPSLSDALSKAENTLYDLIISDFFIAGDTAQDVLSKFEGTPVVVVSGMENQTIIDELYESGAYSVLQKPINKKELHALFSEI